MNDNEVVASYLPPRYLFVFQSLLLLLFATVSVLALVATAICTSLLTDVFEGGFEWEVRDVNLFTRSNIVSRTIGVEIRQRLKLQTSHE